MLTKPARAISTPCGEGPDSKLQMTFLFGHRRCHSPSRLTVDPHTSPPIAAQSVHWEPPTFTVHNSGRHARFFFPRVRASSTVARRPSLWFVFSLDYSRWTRLLDHMQRWLTPEISLQSIDVPQTVRIACERLVTSL